MPTAMPGSSECWIGLTVVHSWDPVKIAETPLTGADTAAATPGKWLDQIRHSPKKGL